MEIGRLHYFAAMLYAYGISNPIAQILYSIMYIAGLSVYCIEKSKRKLLSVVIILILLLYSFLIIPGTFEAITGPDFSKSLIVLLLFVYFPIFLISSSSQFRFDDAFPVLYHFSLIVNCLCVLAYISQAFFSGTGLQEYMTFAYTGLSSIMIGFYYSYKQKHFLGIIISTLSCLTVVLGGCRGALLTITVFLSLILIFNVKKNSSRFIIIISAILLFLNINTVISITGDILGQFGYESRILQLLENEELVESEGRDLVFQKALSIISPLGHGIFSDRILLEHVSDAVYCHNIILEILVDFGIFTGGAILGIILIACIKSIRLNTIKYNLSHTFLVYYSISMIFVKYMLSSSYLISPEIALIFAWYLKNSVDKMNK